MLFGMTADDRVVRTVYSWPSEGLMYILRYPFAQCMSSVIYGLKVTGSVFSLSGYGSAWYLVAEEAANPARTLPARIPLRSGLVAE